MFTKRIPLKTRFLSKIKKTKSCWLWTGHLCNGYGYIYSGIKGKSNISAHRVSWQIFKGKIPSNMNVLHKCDNPACVNPKHLFLGTQKDNVKDMMQKGRHRIGKRIKGEKNNLAKFTNKQVKIMRILYKKYNVNIKHLYELLNVDRKTISRILRKETYSNV